MKLELQGPLFEWALSKTLGGIKQCVFLKEGPQNCIKLQDSQNLDLPLMKL